MSSRSPNIETCVGLNQSRYLRTRTATRIRIPCCLFMLQAGKEKWQEEKGTLEWGGGGVGLIQGGSSKISFFLSNFNFKVHLILYQLISVMLGDWRPSTLCIWLRCREALESVMKKALGGNMGRGLAQWVCEVGRGRWLSIKGGREWRKGAKWLTGKGVSNRKRCHFLSLSVSPFFVLPSLVFCWSGAPQCSKVAGWAHGWCVSEAGWVKRGLRAQQEHSIQFTDLSHMAPGAARGTLPWWSAPAAHKLCRGNKRTGQTLLRRFPVLSHSLSPPTTFQPPF